MYRTPNSTYSNVVVTRNSISIKKMPTCTTVFIGPLFRFVFFLFLFFTFSSNPKSTPKPKFWQRTALTWKKSNLNFSEIGWRVVEGEHFRYFHSVLSCRSALHCALSQIISFSLGVEARKHLFVSVETAVLVHEIRVRLLIIPNVRSHISCT